MHPPLRVALGSGFAYNPPSRGGGAWPRNLAAGLLVFLHVAPVADRLEGLANQYGNLGVIHRTRGDFAAARASWVTAGDLHAKIGMPYTVKQMEDWPANPP